MKYLTLCFLLVCFSVFCQAQDFEWAKIIDFAGANEVAGMDVNSQGEVFLTGVFSSDASLPYDGDSYLIKTDEDGEELWTKVIGPNVFFGDLVCAGEDVIIVGQSTDFLQCNGAVFADLEEYLTYMFLIKVNSNGEVDWIQQFSERHGQFASLDYHDGVIALQCGGAFNSGNHVMHFDGDGIVLQEREFEDFDLVEIAYHDQQTYLSCHGSFGDSFNVDGVFIEAPSQESPTFVLALDEDLTASWAHSTSAINNNDGVIAANSSGVYSYQTVLTENFQFTSELWKFDMEGNLVQSVQPPVFTNAISLYPDLDVGDCHVVLFAQEDFNFNSHEVIMFDHDLNVIDEKQITGNSNLYSGQVSIHDNQIYVSHVHTDNLNFNGEVEIIDLLDDAFQFPYLAKIAVSEICGSVQGDCQIEGLSIVPQDCENGEFMVDFQFDYSNTSNGFSASGNGNDYGEFVYGETFYTIGPFVGDGTSVYELMLTDNGTSTCSTFIEFGASDCDEGFCSIENLEVFNLECETDTTYSLTFNADITNNPNDSLELTVNNQDFYMIGLNQLPLTISGIELGDLEEGNLLLCASGLNACCAIEGFEVPDCLIDNIQEKEVNVVLYPNPVERTLIFQFGNEVISVAIFDSAGKEVFRNQNQTSGEIDVSFLSAGVYQIYFKNADEKGLIKKFIKM